MTVVPSRNKYASTRMFFLYMFMLYCNVSFTQSYPFQKYTTHDGLVQHQAMCIFQDSYNNIWVGTKGGLSLFDGQTFTNFVTEEDGLAEMSVLDFVEDSKGTVWILTSTGLSSYDGYQLAFDRIENQRLRAPLVLAKDDALIAMSSDRKRIYEINGKTCIDLLEDLELPWESLLGFLYDHKEERLLISSRSSGVFAFSNGQLNKLNGPDLIRYYVLKDMEEQIYIVDYKKEGTQLCQVKGNNYDVIFQDSRPIRNIRFTKEDGFFFSVGGHLYRRNKQGVFFDYKMQFNKINDLLIDKEGTLWIATEEGIIHLTSTAFVNYEYNENNLVDYVWSMVEDDDKNIWLAGYQQGLCRFDGEKFERIPLVGKDLPEHIGGYYYGAIKSKNGNLLFPIGKGLLRYDGKEFSQIKEAGDDPVLDLFEDVEKDLLFVGTKKSCRIIDKDKEVRIIDQSKGLHTNRYIVSMGKDRNSDYWLGSYDGLSRYNYDKDKVVATYTKADSTFLPKGVVYIYKDLKENMWFGSTDGLYMYNYSSDDFKRIGKEYVQGFVGFIAEVDSSKLLLGLANEIVIFDLMDYYETNTPSFTFFNNSNGFSGYNSDQNVFLKDSQGDIWIPAANLLSKFTPQKVGHNVSASALKIKTLSVQSEKDKFSWDILANNQNQLKEEIRIPHNQNSVKLDYRATSFSKPRPIPYQIILESLDQTWSESTTKESIIYTDLPSGSYTFSVRSMNSASNEFDEKIRPSVAFIIEAAWWERWWARLLFLIAIVSVLGLPFLYLLYRKTKKENVKLEEDNRTLEKEKLENEVLHLKQRMQTLQVEAIQSQLNYHFMANALNSIQYFIYNKEPLIAAKYLKDLSTLMRTFLEATKSKTFKLSEELEFIKLYVKFEQLRFEDRFDVVYEIDSDANLDEEIPPMLLQPFVENAINHGILFNQKKGLLSIKIYQTNENLIKCIIQDDGVGRKKSNELQEKSKNSYKSRGIQIIKERIKVMDTNDLRNIDIQIDDVFNEKKEVEGTIVLISIDLE